MPIPVPEVAWEEPQVTIREGDDRQVCFTTNIGTATPYEVEVGARPKGGSTNPATLGKWLITQCCKPVMNPHHNNVHR